MYYLICVFRLSSKNVFNYGNEVIYLFSLQVTSFLLFMAFFWSLSSMYVSYYTCYKHVHIACKTGC